MLRYTSNRFRGFVILPIILLVLLISTLSYLIFKKTTWTKSTSIPATFTPMATQTPVVKPFPTNAETGWQTYHGKYFSFEFPKSWKMDLSYTNASNDCQKVVDDPALSNMEHPYLFYIGIYPCKPGIFYNSMDIYAIDKLYTTTTEIGESFLAHPEGPDSEEYCKTDTECVNKYGFVRINDTMINGKLGITIINVPSEKQASQSNHRKLVFVKNNDANLTYIIGYYNGYSETNTLETYQKILSTIKFN